MTHIKQIESNPDFVDFEKEISERQERITRTKIGTLYPYALTAEIERIRKLQELQVPSPSRF